MNSFDFIVIALSTAFMFRGFWVGFVGQIAFIAAMILGYLAAGELHGDFSHYLTPFIESRQLVFLLTCMILFVVVYVAVMLLGVLLKKVMHVTFLGWFDRMLGGIFGFGKAFLLVNLLFMLLATTLSGSSTFLRKSYFYPYLTETSQMLLAIVQDEKLRKGFLPKEPAISNILSLPSFPAIKPGKESNGNSK